MTTYKVHVGGASFTFDDMHFDEMIKFISTCLEVGDSGTEVRVISVEEGIKYGMAV